LGPRNSPGCSPPRWWAAAEGERRGERRPVVVAPSSWLGEVRGAHAVLTVALTRRFHGRRCRGEPRQRAGREEAKQRCFYVTVAARVRSHSAVAACAACGGGVAGGRPRRHEVAGGDHATAAPTCAWAGTRGYGLTCATGKRALSLVLFPKFQNQHKICNSIW
jgi:hypothetical protein